MKPLKVNPKQRFGLFQTKPWVARFILDLINFKESFPIEYCSVLDPGCGNGVFLIEALKRSFSRALLLKIDINLWVKNITKLFVGYEINQKMCEEARYRVYNFLTSEVGISKFLAESAAKCIVIQGDFLKWKPKMKYDIIVGNPPFVRYDNIDKKYIKWLRDHYSCFRGRADLCIPFIQHSLELLSEKGKIAFICTNRFTLCEYGKFLRDLITKKYSITKIVDFTKIKPFDSPVSTYPWIFVFENKTDRKVLFSQISNSYLHESSFSISKISWRKIDRNYFSKDPWRIPEKNLVKLWDDVKKINSMQLGDPEFGINIKVGIATGADSVFINPPTKAQVERELLVPILLSRNLKESRNICKTDLLLNTWDPNNSDVLIKLEDWPKASRYLTEHKAKLESRYIAKKNPEQWYRLIDRLNLEIIKKEKLVFPSLRRRLEVYFDKGTCIPHHNCYYATKKGRGGPSLLAIGAILSSNIVNCLASVLAIKFNGRASRLLKSSFLEIPMPEPKLIIERQSELESSFLKNDTEKIDTLVKELYNISK